MMPISKQIVQYYMDNPNTNETAIEVALRFNYHPEERNQLRGKRVRDLKRSAMAKLLKGDPLYMPNPQSEINSNTTLGTYDENLEKGTLEVSSGN